MDDTSTQLDNAQPLKICSHSGSNCTSGGENLIIWVTVAYLKPIFLKDIYAHTMMALFSGIFQDITLHGLGKSKRKRHSLTEWEVPVTFDEGIHYLISFRALISPKGPTPL